MKNKFSTKWKSSKQPRKQRKFRANAPLHLRKNFVVVNLSKLLREKQGKRNSQVKKGDIVKIMRGTHKKKTGKVLRVNLKDSRIVVEGVQAKKQDGSKVNLKLQPSNLQIIELSEKTTSKASESSEIKNQEKIKKEKKTMNKPKKITKEETKTKDLSDEKSKAKAKDFPDEKSKAGKE